MRSDRVRAVVLTGFNEVARFVGLDPLAQLKKSRINPGDLLKEDNRIPAHAVAELLERCAYESDRPDFSLLLAECRSFSSFGPVTLILKHEATLASVIKSLGKFKRYLNDVIAVHLEKCGDVTLLSWTLPSDIGGPQSKLLVAALGYRLVTGAMGGAWLPERVHLSIPRPSQPQAFARYFGVPIEFESHFNGLSFATADLQQKNVDADPQMAEHAASLLRLAPPPPENIVDRTRHALVLLLPIGKVTLADVGKNLGVSERTLQRQLKLSGCTFAELLEETRRVLAARYLSSSAQNVSDVASMVGYSSVSSFSRWFTEQFGVSPSTWRRRHRPAGGSA